MRHATWAEQLPPIGVLVVWASTEEKCEKSLKEVSQDNRHMRSLYVRKWKLASPDLRASASSCFTPALWILKPRSWCGFGLPSQNSFQKNSTDFGISWRGILGNISTRSSSVQFCWGVTGGCDLTKLSSWSIAMISMDEGCRAANFHRSVRARPRCRKVWDAAF